MLIDPRVSAGASSGLHGPSVVTCVNLYTIEQSSSIKTIGHLSVSTMVQVDACLKAAFELP